MGIATQTSDGLKFSTTYMYVKNSSGTTVFTFKSDGNLGIGTNNAAVNPLARLAVGDGDRNAGAAVQNQAGYFSGTKTAFAGSGNKGLWQGQLHVADDSALAAGIGGAITFGATQDNTNGTYLASIEGSRDNATSGQYGASMIFRTRTNGSAVMGAHMVINSVGNVGIGTASPDVALHVNSSSDQHIILSGSTYPYIRFQEGSTSRAYVQWHASYDSLLFRNEQADNFDFLTHATGGGLNIRLKGSDHDVWGSVYADENGGSHTIGFLDGDQHWALQHIKDTSWDFRINNSSKMFLDADGNVGIGTASPVEKLDVAGKQRITQNIVSNATYQMLAFGSNRGINDYGGLNKDYWRINVVTPGASTTGEGSAHGYGSLVFSGVTDSNTTYLNRFVIRADGNIGIGTNVPSAKLHIQSDGSHDEGAEIVLRHSNNNTTDVVSTISFQNNGGQVAMMQAGTTGANNTGYISFFTDSTGTSGERMRIQGNGYVGIGTATAYSPLQVYSSADQKILLSGSANPYIRWQNGGSNRAYIQWIENGSIFGFFNSVGDNFDFFTHDAGGATNLRLKGSDGDIWGSFYAQEGTNPAHEVGILDADQNWALRHVNDTSWDFRINNDSKMTINSSGTVAIGGTTLLTNEGMVLNRSGGAGYVAFYDGSGGAKWNIQRNAGVTNCLRIHAYNNTSQVFKVTKNYNSTDGFNILLDSGSVGMGTNYPNKTLEVRYVSTSTDVTAEGLGGGSAGKGLLIYNNNQSNNNVYANLDFRARNADGRIAYQYQTAANVGDFHFITDNTNSPKTQMIIKNDGKVGMGTVTPAARLHVYRPAGTVPGLLVDSNRDGARVNFNYSSSTTTFGEIGMTHYGSSGDCQIWMGANLNSNSSSHSGPAVGVAGTGASSWYTVWNTQTAQDFYGIYRRAPSPSSSYENYFRIKSDGNVGINTTNPTDRLHIRSVQAAGNGSGSNLATLSLETYNSNSDDHGSYVKCKNYGGGGGGPDWKIGGMEGYWTTNKVASIDFVTGDDWYNPGNKDEGEIAFTVYNNTGSGSTAIEAMRIHQTGNIGIGSTNPGSKLTVNGSFSASSKSFLIDHPTKENKKLEHGCLEGPEFGVYHRGTTQSNTITLPDYWSGLVREGTVTVQLTPKGSFQHLYVVSQSLTEIVIGAADGETIDCFYTIYGERADIDSLVVEKDV
jgi:hypothetical protein